LAAGVCLGPYEILALIGAGGMGEVYRARDSRLNRDVAIKVSQERFSERFRREARAIASLNHPNICALYDVGPNYLVMEYIEGAPLRGPLPAESALVVALQIVAALAAAHAKGITHRDIKPGNILVAVNPGQQPRVTLLDFGLAKVEDEGAPCAGPTITQTQPGTVIGTAAYMSPEQASGQTADARSDIFSFGAVLYELLTGRRAFDGGTWVATIAAFLHQEPEPFEAPPDLERAVSRCLRKSPAARFQTAAELKAALEAIDVAAGRQPSIAELPFANMSGDKEQEYFSDGLAEEILNALAQIPGLKVIARTSSFAFKGQNMDVRRIAAELGVTNILEGSVRKAGDRVRVTAQLIAATDGSHVWSQRYDRLLADVFAIQDELAEAIATASKASCRPMSGGRGATLRICPPTSYS
jgi:serine/threonine protein kinase